jgi:hypothetical protein
MPPLPCRLQRFAATCVAAWLAGCALQPPLPPGLDMGQANVQALGIAADVQLEEVGWKSPSARTGGLAGAGLGFGIGGLMCTGTGFLAPLGLATVVPLGTVVGAVGGATVGAAQSRAAPGVDDKRALLTREWTALAARAPLADALQRRWPAPTTAAPRWHVQVGYATLGSVGSGDGQPFAVEATAKLVVLRSDGPAVHAERVYAERSLERLTLAQWGADEALALRRALDALATNLAARIEADLAAAR